MKKQNAELEWLSSHPKEVEKYSGKWVAAKDCRIVAAADSLEGLLSELGDGNLESLIIDRIEHPAWMVYR